MGGYFSEIFNSAHDDVPLHERSVLRVAPRSFWQGDDTLPGPAESLAVNFQTVLETGHMPQDGGASSWNDLHIDWSSDDAFTQSIKQVRENTVERIKQDPDLQALLDKDSWSREDRVQWERSVSAIVNEEHLKMPGLSAYRNGSMVNDPENEGEKIPAYPTVERRASRLNDLSLDIENDTQTIVYSCETMSVFEGVILQQIDNEMLPDSAPDGDLKEGANYFYVVGRVNFEVGKSVSDIPHAWVVSSATTNVIDGAAAINSYRENVNVEATFEDFVRGDVFHGSDGSVYTHYQNELSDITRMRIDRGDIDFDKIYESIPLRGEITQKTFDEAPPEAQSLIELKTRIVALEKASLDENGVQTEPGKVSAYRSRFDRALNEMVDDAGIYEVVDYDPPRRDDLTASNVGQEEKFTIAAEWVKEMHPGWGGARVDAYVQDRIGYKIPEMESGEYQSYGDFREAMLRDKIKEEFPDIDFDEAKEFSESIQGMQMFGQYMEMLGTGKRDDALMSDPQMQMVRAYRLVEMRMTDFPEPGTPAAHAKEVSNLKDLQKEYNDFKQQAADIDGAAPGVVVAAKIKV